MTTRHIFQTDDIGLAAKLHATILQHHGHPGAAAASTIIPAPAPLALPAATPPAQLPPPPPPPPAAPAAPAAAAVDPAMMVAPAGWTVDHVRGAAKAFVDKNGSEGSTKLGALAMKYCPPGTAKPGVSKVMPAYWPNFYAELTA